MHSPCHRYAWRARCQLCRQHPGGDVLLHDCCVPDHDPDFARRVGHSHITPVAHRENSQTLGNQILPQAATGVMPPIKCNDQTRYAMIPAPSLREDCPNFI